VVAENKKKRKWGWHYIKQHAKPQDAFLFAAGLAILYHEIWGTDEAQAVVIGAALFLMGLVPAFWADRAPSPPPPPGPPSRPDPPAERDHPGASLCVAVV
jgi:hypothetical protein